LYDFTESHATSCKQFHCQSPILGSLKRVYWKDFKKYEVISKEQAKTLSLMFSSTKKQKIGKTISAGTENTFLLF
jgi:hypothetical protein